MVLFKDSKTLTKAQSLLPYLLHVHSRCRGLFLTRTHSALLLEVVRMYAWLTEKISTLPRLHKAVTHSWHFGGFVMEIVVPSCSSYQVDT